MTNINHTCENCDSEFTIKYDKELCESDPFFCPFCAEVLFFDDSEIDDE